MSLRYLIDEAGAHVRISGSGRLTMEEMTELIDRIATDSRYRQDFGVVFDLRNAHYTPELNDGNLFVGVITRRQTEFRGRFALVVPESLHVLASLYCVLAEVAGFDRLKCFRDLGDACAWCGVTA
jgi:hypothetical protein